MLLKDYGREHLLEKPLRNVEFRSRISVSNILIKGKRNMTFDIKYSLIKQVNRKYGNRKWKIDV